MHIRIVCDVLFTEFSLCTIILQQTVVANKLVRGEDSPPNIFDFRRSSLI
jgi:hypothetical protein